MEHYEPFNHFDKGAHILYLSDKDDRRTIEDLRLIARDDQLKSSAERFDTVVMPEPDEEEFEALAELSPTHLEVYGGFMEEAYLEPVDELPKWRASLRRLTLGGLIEFEWPQFTANIESLTLDFCCGLQFVAHGPGNSATFGRLKKLQIIENDAISMFGAAFEEILGLAAQLEVLELRSTNGCDHYNSPANDLAEFRSRLSRCVGMRELKLTLAPGRKRTGPNRDPDVRLAQSLPPNLERLEFHCTMTREMLQDLDNWLEAAKNPQWLPKLNSMVIRCDSNHHEAKYGNTHARSNDDPELGTQFQAKIGQIDEAFKTRATLVKII